MSKSEKHTGIAIAIAWPQTYCKQSGAWYDNFVGLLGFSKNNYYKVGHAAIVLFNKVKSECHYFDFGRYHAPFQHGRVRSAKTDYNLAVKTKPIISTDGKTLLNYIDILNELQHNYACHGEGDLHASYTSINFENAFEKALQMQQKSPIRYGPFRYNGSNCSRFVCSVLNAGQPNWFEKIKLNVLIPLTPTPLTNVNAFNNKKIIAAINGKEIFEPKCKLNISELKSTLKEPEKKEYIPDNAQWLSGEGAGSWFAIQISNSSVIAQLYSPNGDLECTSVFKNTMPDLINNNFKVTYPSNCSQITLEINNNKILLQQ